MALLGVVLMTSFTLYSAGLRAYERRQEDFEKQQNIRYALMRLSSSIRLAKKVDIMSRSKIKLITPRDETIYYSLEYGTLYRVKNDGKNAIAYLKALEFTRPEDENCIYIHMISLEKEKPVEITTRVTPFGIYIMH